jgi:DNA-binding transcriptional MerR regulator
MDDGAAGKITMPIGDFSRISSIPISTLRYYDEIDLLKPADVDPFSQYRFYSTVQLYEANFIETWKALGFTLTEIKCLMAKGTGDLAESCYKKQITAMEEEISRRRKRKGEMERNLRLLERFSGLSAAELSAITRKVIPEEYLLTLDDKGSPDYPLLVEKRKKIEKLVEKHGLSPDPESPFLTTRFLETCEEEGHQTLFQLPLIQPGDHGVKEIVKVPIHAALCTWHKGPAEGIPETIKRIREFATDQVMNIGKSVSCVYWIDPNITLDESQHITEIRIPLKKKKPVDSQVT